jgi:hypothetical protein
MVMTNRTAIDEGAWEAWLDGARLPYVVPRQARVREDAEDWRRHEREEAVLGGRETVS